MNEHRETSHGSQAQLPPSIGDVGPMLDLVFAILSFTFWAYGLGLFGEGATLAIGLLQLGVFATYTVGGILLVKRGNAFGGNCFLLFGALFGAVGGLTHLGMVVAECLALPFETRILGLSFLICGLFILATLPGMIRTTKVGFLLFLSAGLGVTCFGLTGTGLVSPSLNDVAAWLLFIAGLLASYNTTSGMLGFLGINLPLGRAFIGQRS